MPSRVATECGATVTATWEGPRRVVLAGRTNTGVPGTLTRPVAGVRALAWAGSVVAMLAVALRADGQDRGPGGAETVGFSFGTA